MNAPNNLRRADTTKGPPVRVLTLDGGGVRGYSMLILLQELMHRTFVEIHGRAPRKDEIPKPCDHFDLIAGTGTGGLIALMLGRLRLHVETCKDLYVRMTKRVFETDKTIAGIPYRSTLFKASKLEETMREAIREHTVFEDEGNDSLASAVPMTPTTPRSMGFGGHQRSASTSSRYSSNMYSPVSTPQRTSGTRLGNSNALLYDIRENRTKTAITAVYRGTPKTGKAALLRSYDSRSEPPPDFDCTIWQAGRATCATGLAFKPIQIGQSIFLDDGAGTYNPSPQILDEAAVNEYPGREIGVFVSVGTGKRPTGTQGKQSEWWEGFLGDSMGQWAEARRRLIAKIEGCEETHQFMLREHLPSRGVDLNNYYRLNVEVGVGEFAMNEWNRLSDISTNTRMYLARDEIQTMNRDAAAKLARIHNANLRHGRKLDDMSQSPPRPYSWQESVSDDVIPPPSNPLAVELPAEDVTAGTIEQTSKYQQIDGRTYRQASHDDKFAVAQPNFGTAPQNPPPIPPKTPIRSAEPFPPWQQLPRYTPEQAPRPSSEHMRPSPPYPDTDGPPPTVNKANKPQFGIRQPQGQM